MSGYVKPQVKVQVGDFGDFQTNLSMRAHMGKFVAKSPKSPKCPLSCADIDDSTPVATIIAVHRHRSGRTVEIKCPYCTRRHTHGWPEGDSAPGLRRPHCVNKTIDTPDYYVPAPPEQATARPEKVA